MSDTPAAPLLAAARFGRPASAQRYPFAVPSLQPLFGSELTFDQPVTLFVGENGSGKSTLLQAIAIAAASIGIGAADPADDATLAAVRPLAELLRLVWRKRSRRGFFLRAADLLNFAVRVERMRAESEAELREIDDDASAGPTARALRRMPHVGSLHGLQHHYAEGLLKRSHGESFLQIFRSRMQSGGLYLLDEPEAALSAHHQLVLLSLWKELVEQQQAQVIAATHSPILQAFPAAVIYEFRSEGVQRTRYEDLESVTLLRDFLQAPQRFLRRL